MCGANSMPSGPNSAAVCPRADQHPVAPHEGAVRQRHGPVAGDRYDLGAVDVKRTVVRTTGDPDRLDFAAALRRGTRA